MWNAFGLQVGSPVALPSLELPQLPSASHEAEVVAAALDTPSELLLLGEEVRHFGQGVAPQTRAGKPLCALPPPKAICFAFNSGAGDHDHRPAGGGASVRGPPCHAGQFAQDSWRPEFLPFLPHNAPSSRRTAPARMRRLEARGGGLPLVRQSAFRSASEEGRCSDR